MSTPEFPSNISDQIVHVDEIGRREAKLVANDLDLPLALKSLIPSDLYRHQYDAIKTARAGNDVLVSTGTNSGKSLCFQVPALAACCEEPMARALFLYPTKALAHDQLGRLEAMGKELSV